MSGRDRVDDAVARACGGDVAAFEDLYRATVDRIHALCLRMCGDPHLAEELTQEVYFKLWENLHRYNAGSNFMAWAWRVAKNLIIDSYRRGRREREAAWLDPEILDRLPGSDDPHAQTERRQRLRLIGTALRQLDVDVLDNRQVRYVQSPKHRSALSFRAACVSLRCPACLRLRHAASACIDDAGRIACFGLSGRAPSAASPRSCRLRSDRRTFPRRPACPGHPARPS